MAEWLNPEYSAETINQVKRSFALSGNVQLLSFLTQKGLDEFKNLKFNRIYNPMKYSYNESEAPPFAHSKEFSRLISILLGKKISLHELSCRQFSHGDYTVLYDALKPGKGIVILLDINYINESWGGYTSFIKGSEEAIRVVARKNALTIVNQSGMKSFVKYMNHNAQNPRIFLYGIARPIS